MLGADHLARLVAVELHAVEFTQQVVGELDVGLVDFIDQQGHGPVCSEGLPQYALDDVVVDVMHTGRAFHISELAVPQTTDRIVLIQALLCLGGGLDVPLQQRHA
ncbi:hypothetical protein D3C72_1591900 [compost metagenome]